MTPDDAVDWDEVLEQMYGQLVEEVQAYHPDPDLDALRTAFELGRVAHEGQRRKSGEPYFTHPVEVTQIVAGLRLDVASLCASLLHDVVEDTPVELADIADQFGGEVAFLVDGLTKLNKLRFNTREERQAENFRKMVIAMSRDLRVILVKLCDRVHNMRTLQHMKPHKQVVIAQETLDIYAPLANRLGISRFKVELEDLSLRYLHSDEYADLVNKIARTEEERKKYIEEVLTILDRVLSENGLKGFELQGRPKHLFSIFRKMQRSNIEFDQVYDMLAFRIITDSVAQCYEALGVVHNLWKPIPGRFKDYIAIPKPNMYQSLHTSVMGPYRERIEIQIRTREMHRVAEEGVAAHWMYKEGKMSGSPGEEEQKFAWLRQLMEWQKDLTDPKEFLETVKIDLFADEVYVFTPKGEVRSFPKGATPIDFAYAVHTEVGHHCAGAKVNGQIVPLKYQLRNGDIVEIITNSNQRPKQDWLQFAASSRARTKIRQFVRKEQRARSREIGRQLLEKAFRRAGLNFAKLEKAGDLEAVLSDLKVGSLDEMFIQVGLGRMQAETVISKLVEDEPQRKQDLEDSRFGKLLNRIRRRSKSGISVDGVDDVMVRFAKCCSPVPGEPIMGFVTRGRGITVHSTRCDKIRHLEPERRIDVHWDVKDDGDLRRAVNLRVVCADRPGMLSDISKSIAAMSINISQAHCRTTEDRRAINTFEVLVKDLKQLRGAIKQLSRIPGVYSVERVRS